MEGIFLSRKNSGITQPKPSPTTEYTTQMPFFSHNNSNATKYSTGRYAVKRQICGTFTMIRIFKKIQHSFYPNALKTDNEWITLSYGV